MIDDKPRLVGVLGGIGLQPILGAVFNTFAVDVVWFDNVQLRGAPESLDSEFVHCPCHLIWVFLGGESEHIYIYIWNLVQGYLPV